MTRVIVGGIISAFLLTLGVSAQDYEVKLVRAQKAGDKYDLTATCVTKVETKLSADGEAEEKKQEQTVKLSGEVTVVEVDPTIKEQTKIKMKVKSATVGRGDKTEELLKAGDEVVIWHEGSDLVITVNGNTVEEQVAAILEPMLSVHRQGSPSDDDVMGTKARKKVGEKWPINAELAAKEWSEGGEVVPKESVSGETTISGLAKKDGVDCLKIESEMRVKGLNLPMPPGLKVTKSEIVLKFWGLYPTDLAKDMTSGGMVRTMNVSASGKAGPVGEQKTLGMDAKETQTLTVEVKPK